jgi:site-specific DNA-adenine methylase
MKNNNHFFMPYTGNKRNEVDELINKIDFKEIKTVYEPFCGSSAYSFHIWLKYGNKFDYHLNDNNKLLIDFYHLFKNNTLEEINEGLLEIKNKTTTKEDWDYYYKTTEDTVIKNLFFWKFSGMRRIGMFPLNRPFSGIFKPSSLQLKFLEFIKSPNVYITNNDWLVSFNLGKNEPSSLFIFDPPYINCDNSFYVEKTLNVYQYFYEYRLTDYHSQIYFILEDMWIIRMLFSHYRMYEPYKKKYKYSRKDTAHIIISNCCCFL